MASEQLKLYRPFENKVSKVTSMHGAFDRLKQNLWGEPQAKEVNVKVIHSVYDTPSSKIYFLASKDEIHLEVHNNPDLYQHLHDLIELQRTQRSFSRYSIARFMVDNGFDLNY